MSSCARIFVPSLELWNVGNNVVEIVAAHDNQANALQSGRGRGHDALPP